MAAITWRNVNGPSIAEAARPMELARQSFADAFTGLNNVIVQREAMIKRDEDKAKEQAKAGFLNMLYSAKTPEALEALQGSEEFKRLQSGLSAKDQIELAGKGGERLTALYDQTNKANTYTDKQEERNNRGAVADIETDILAGRDVTEKVKNLPAHMQTPLMKGQDARGQVLVERANAVKAEERTQGKHEMDMRKGEATIAQTEAETNLMPLRGDLLRAQSNSANSSANANNAQATYYRSKASTDATNAAAAKTVADTAAGDSLRTKAMDEFIKKSPYSNGSLDTNQGQEALLKAMKDMKFTPGQIEDTMYNLNKYYGTGAELTDAKGAKYKVPLPVDEVIRAINQSSDNPLAIGFSRRGDDVVNILRKQLGNADKVDNIVKAQQVIQNREVPELLAPRPNPLNIEVGKKKVTR